MKTSFATILTTVLVLQSALVQAQSDPGSNSPPNINCPLPITVECPAPAVLTASVSDADGGPLFVVWNVNGTDMETNVVVPSGPLVLTNVSFTVSLPLGTNTVKITAIDDKTNSASCSSTVTVVDTTPPVIESVSATPNVLWPPNHKLIAIRVRAVVTDPCDSTTWKIIGVTSNEAVLGHGSGHTTPDWVITGDHTVKLRSERAGSGSSRVYTITIQATDASGNVSEPATVTVTVPHDRGHGHGHK